MDGRGSQKRLPKRRVGAGQGSQASRCNHPAEGSRMATSEDVGRWNSSIATEQLGCYPGILTYDEVRHELEREAQTSQEYTQKNEFSILRELTVPDAMQDSLGDTNKPALHRHNITHDHLVAEGAIESELINQMSMYPESANILEKSIERSLTQTRMHQVLQFSDAELGDAEPMQPEDDQMQIKSSSSTEFEDVTPYNLKSYQQYQDDVQDYVLDFTKGGGGIQQHTHHLDEHEHVTGGTSQLYSSLDQDEQDGDHYYRTQNINGYNRAVDDSHQLISHHQQPRANPKVKKMKKKPQMKQSSSNQELVRRLRELNQEKHLLLRQLHLQRQIDDNTTSYMVQQKTRSTGKTNTRFMESNRSMQKTARATDKTPAMMSTNTKRKRSAAGATHTATAAKSSIKQQRIGKQSKEKYATTQTLQLKGKQTKLNKSQTKFKEGFKENDALQTQRVYKSRSYMLTKAGAIKKISQKLYQPRNQVQSRNQEDLIDLQMRSSQRTAEIDELTNRYNEYLHTQQSQSRKGSLVTSSRSLPRGRSGSQSRRTSRSKNGGVQRSNGVQQMPSPHDASLQSQYTYVDNRYQDQTDRSEQKTSRVFGYLSKEDYATLTQTARDAIDLEAAKHLIGLTNEQQQKQRLPGSLGPSINELHPEQAVQPLVHVGSDGTSARQSQLEDYDQHLQEQPSQNINAEHGIRLQGLKLQVQQSNATQQSSGSFQSPTFKNRHSTNQGSGLQTPHIREELAENQSHPDDDNERYVDETESEHQMDKQFGQVQQISRAVIDEGSESESINRELENTFNQAQRGQLFAIQIPDGHQQYCPGEEPQQESIERADQNHLLKDGQLFVGGELDPEAIEEPKIYTPKSSRQGQKRKGNKSSRGNSTSRESRGTTARDSRENSRLQKFITDSQQRMSQRSRRDGRSTGLRTERSRNNLVNHDIELSQEQIALGCEQSQGHTARDWSIQQAQLLQQQSLRSLVQPMSEQSSSYSNQVIPAAPLQCHRRGQSQSKNPSQSNHTQSRDSKVESQRGSHHSNNTEKSEATRSRGTCTPLAQSKPADPQDCLMKFQTRQSNQFQSHVERNKFNLQTTGRSNYHTSRSNTRYSPSMLHSRREQPRSGAAKWNPFFQKQEPPILSKYASQLNFDLVKPSLKKVKPVRATRKMQQRQSQALAVNRRPKVCSLGSRRDQSNSLSLARRSNHRQKSKKPEFNIANRRRSPRSKSGCFGTPEKEEEIIMKKPIKRSKAKIQEITNRLYRPKSCGQIPPVLEPRNDKSRSQSATPCRSWAVTERPVGATSQANILSKVNQKKSRAKTMSTAARGSRRRSKNKSNCTGAATSAFVSKRSSSFGSNLRALQRAPSPNEYQDGKPSNTQFKARPFKNKSPFVALKSTKKLTVPQGRSLMTRRMLLLSHERKISLMSHSNKLASNSKSDRTGSLERDSHSIYPSITGYAPNDKALPSNLNYDDAIAKVENIINSFSTQLENPNTGQVPTLLNSMSKSRNEELVSPAEPRQERYKEASFEYGGDQHLPQDHVHEQVDLPLQQASNVAIFEVGPGDRKGLNRQLLSQQFDLADRALDQKMEHDQQTNTQKHDEAAVYKHDRPKSQQLSHANVTKQEEHFVGSYSGSSCHKDSQQCGLQLGFGQLENTQTPSELEDLERNGDSTQEQTLDIKQLLQNQVQILQTGRSSLSSSNQNSVGTSQSLSRSQQLENQLLEELRNKTCDLGASTPGNQLEAEKQITSQNTSRPGSGLQIRSSCYESTHEAGEAVTPSPQHESIYVDDDGLDDGAGSGFDSSSANQAVNETVFYMPPIDDTTQGIGGVYDYQTRQTPSKLQASAKPSMKSNLPR